MADFANEAAAEDFLIGAVVGGDSAPLANTEISLADDVDREDDETADDEVKQAGEAEQEQEKPEAKAKTEAEPPEEDEIEIPGEDGKEPTRLKLKDVLADYQEFQQFKAHKDQAIERVQQEYVQAATQEYQQVRQFTRETGAMIQAALQMLQPPQPPNADLMLNPQSPQYDPDGYHRQFAQYQRAQASFGQAEQYGRQLLQRAEQAEAQAREVRETQELQRLQRAWPEFGQKETMDKFVGEMSRHYGISAEELDEILVDHRQALVARDALAFRAMKAQSGDVKAKVEAKAPKLVRSKQEAKASPQQARDTKGQFVSGALAELKKTNSDDAAAKLFAGLIKAGRI